MSLDGTNYRVLVSWNCWNLNRFLKKVKVQGNFFSLSLVLPFRKKAWEKSRGRKKRRNRRRRRMEEKKKKEEKKEEKGGSVSCHRILD